MNQKQGKATKTKGAQALRTSLTHMLMPAMLAMLSTASCAQNEAEISQDGLVNESPQTEATHAATPGGYQDMTYAAQKSVNTVVHIMTKQMPKNGSAYGGRENDLLDFFFGERGFQQLQPQPKQASGSGVILEEDGYIVTNNHVVDGADSITVILNDKRSYEAKLVGTDPSTDLALLKVDATGLPAIKIGDSEKLKVGEWVLAVGNPFNLTSTVTAGIVSAKARNINIISSAMRIESFIQTDAAVNPGNSGGALVNTDGELVGINAAIASQTGSYTGYSFAIPVTIMTKVVQDIKKYGLVQRALLGVQVQEITAELAKKNNLKTLKGAYVANVGEQTAAKEAGIEAGDIITHINGKEVASVPEVQEQVSKFSPGTTIKVTIVRDNKAKDVDVVLRNQNGDTKIVQQAKPADFGATFEPVSKEEKQKYGIESGLKVKSVTKNGKFALSGVKPGYIIVKINNQNIATEGDIQAIVKQMKRQENNNFQEKALFMSGIMNGKIAYYAIAID